MKSPNADPLEGAHLPSPLKKSGKRSCCEPPCLAGGLDFSRKAFDFKMGFSPGFSNPRR